MHSRASHLIGICNTHRQLTALTLHISVSHYFTVIAAAMLQIYVSVTQHFNLTNVPVILLQSVKDYLLVLDFPPLLTLPNPIWKLTFLNSPSTPLPFCPPSYCQHLWFSIITELVYVINACIKNLKKILLSSWLISSIGSCRWRCCSCECPPSCSVLSSPKPWREAKIKLAQIFLHRS